MNKEQLSKEIETCFSFVEKPKGLELSFHKEECAHCHYLREDLKHFCDSEIPPEAIRWIHQEMSCLSADGWRWVLPSYLRYCLTDVAQYNRDETEFLIYNLSPDKEYEADTLERLSKLDQNQISCLIDFLKWCQSQEFWAEYYLDEIKRGIEFLKNIEA